MPDSFADFGVKMEKVNQGLNGSSLRQITTRVGARAKGALPPKIQPNKLSNFGRRKGAKVTVRYDVKSDHEVAVSPKPAGLAVLLEAGSYKAGTTWKAPRRRGGKRRARGTVGTYTHARVPARKAWSKAVHDIEPDVPKWIDAEVQRVLRGVF